jgi:hypothetical protein
MNKKFPAIFFVFFALIVFSASAFDFWQYPEAADKGSVFAGAHAASIAFNIRNIKDVRFKVYFPEFCLDYVLPIGLPFSLGATLKPFEKGIFGIGIRPAYHINFGLENLDAYVMYAVSFDFRSSYGVLEYGPALGMRYRIFSFFCLSMETAFMMKAVNFGVSLKLN